MRPSATSMLRIRNAGPGSSSVNSGLLMQMFRLGVDGVLVAG